MKTKQEKLKKIEKIIVYILPLRNENQQSLPHILDRAPGLYPTFKEWKPDQPGQSQAELRWVYILPLRNENSKPFLKFREYLIWFISYL